MTPSQVWFISMNWKKRRRVGGRHYTRNEWELSGERAQVRGRLKLEKTGSQCWMSITAVYPLEDNMNIWIEIRGGKGFASKFGSYRLATRKMKCTSDLQFWVSWMVFLDILIIGSPVFFLGLVGVMWFALIWLDFFFFIKALSSPSWLQNCFVVEMALDFWSFHLLY